jgi:hypothetical protein
MGERHAQDLDVYMRVYKFLGPVILLDWTNCLHGIDVGAGFI